jgi:hypothetical protein
MMPASSDRLPKEENFLAALHEKEDTPGKLRWKWRTNSCASIIHEAIAKRAISPTNKPFYQIALPCLAITYRPGSALGMERNVCPALALK